MGTGISLVFAKAGIPVFLHDSERSRIDSALAEIEALCSISVSKGKMTPSALEQVMALITPTADFTGFDDVDIVTEAVFESLPLKEAIFAQLGKITRDGCILASNTSTLDIDAMAAASGHPDRVIGTHFFCPAHVMKLIEIVRGAHTSQRTIDSCVALAERLGKTSVVVGNCFGFVANRMLMHYMRESYLLVEEGCTVAQVDDALVRFGMPMGPFAVQDLVGLDVGARIRHDLRLAEKTMIEGPQSDLPDQVFDSGRYGRKTGAGWYLYSDGHNKGMPDPIIDDIARDAAARRGISRRCIDDEEIVDRTMTAIINEGARLLEAGHVSSADDIDRICRYGFGFPPGLVGPMHYADLLTAPILLRRLQSYEAMYGAHWRPSTFIQRLVREKRRFYN